MCLKELNLTYEILHFYAYNKRIKKKLLKINQNAINRKGYCFFFLNFCCYSYCSCYIDLLVRL